MTQTNPRHTKSMGELPCFMRCDRLASHARHGPFPMPWPPDISEPFRANFRGGAELRSPVCRGGAADPKSQVLVTAARSNCYFGGLGPSYALTGSLRRASFGSNRLENFSNIAWHIHTPTSACRGPQPTKSCHARRQWRLGADFRGGDGSDDLSPLVWG